MDFQRHSHYNRILLALLLYDQLPVVVARDLTDAEVRQLKEIAAAVEPAADWTPVTTDLDAYMRELLEAGVSLVANADEFRISASPMPARGAWPVSCKGWQFQLSLREDANALV